MPVAMGYDITLDVDDATEVRSRHYAFLVDGEDFTAIVERVKAVKIDSFADPGHHRRGELNTRDGGRGFFFSGPDGHKVEVRTRSYGWAAPPDEPPRASPRAICASLHGYAMRCAR